MLAGPGLLKRSELLGCDKCLNTTFTVNIL